MDAHLTVASMRDARSYDDAPVPDDVARRILDSGRLVGSARNRQPTRFIVVEGEAVAAVARTVYRADNVLTAGLVVVISVSPGGNLVDFDAGRAAQNMMLSAWADGVGCCPNGVADADALHRIAGIAPPDRAVVVLSFGYPPTRRDPARRTPEQWSARARRLPLDAVVQRIDSVPS